MKKILAFILTLVFCITPIFAVTDIENHINEDAIECLIDFGVIDGYEDGTYRPDRLITRAEVAKLMVAAITDTLPAEYGELFVDVTNQWYAPYVEKAAELKLVNGYGNGYFKPEANITFREMVTIMLNALGYDAPNLEGKWPSNVISIALEKGLGEDVFARDTEYVTRGEVAQIIYNALDLHLVELYEGKPYELKAIFRENFGRKYTLRSDFTTFEGFGDIVKDYERDAIPDEVVSERVRGRYYGMNNMWRGFAFDAHSFYPVDEAIEDGVNFYLNGMPIDMEEDDFIPDEQNDKIELVFVDDTLYNVIIWRKTDSRLSSVDDRFARGAFFFGDEYKAGESWITCYGNRVIYVSNEVLFLQPVAEIEYEEYDYTYLMTVLCIDFNADEYVLKPYVLITKDTELDSTDRETILGVIENREYLAVRIDYFGQPVEWTPIHYTGPLVFGY